MLTRVGSAAAGAVLALTLAVSAETVFAVVPEVALNVAYQITDRISVFVGYTMLYVNDVVRPGNQIDRTINTTQNVPWVGETTVQGLNVGLGLPF